MIEQSPLCDFRFLDDHEVQSFDVMSLDPHGNTGYFVDCDLEYPVELHDRHNDLPLCPSHLEITREILSDVTIQLGEKHGQKFKPQRKLAPTLLDKTHYVCHSSNLQFYIQHGIILKRIHRILSFTQTDWLKCYIDFNTEKRKNSKSSFEKDLYKLMSNAASISLVYSSDDYFPQIFLIKFVIRGKSQNTRNFHIFYGFFLLLQIFGKSVENVWNHVDMRVAVNEEQSRRLVAKPNFKSFKIVNKDLTLVTYSVENRSLFRQAHLSRMRHLGYLQIDHVPLALRLFPEKIWNECKAPLH